MYIQALEIDFEEPLILIERGKCFVALSKPLLALEVNCIIQTLKFTKYLFYNSWCP